MLRAMALSCLERFQYSKARRSSILALPHDVLRHLALHLKPRHLYKLMVASKRLLWVVDCTSYWERAAAHAVLRHIYSMEIEPGVNQVCQYPQRPGLFNLVNVDYRESIDCVIERARHVLGDLNVAELVRAGEAIILIDPDNYYHIHAAFTHGAATMKEVVKRETLRVLAEQTSVGHKVRKFQRELDDDKGLSGEAKAYLMGKLGALLAEVAEGEMVETELYLFAHMAGDFV